jgi:glycosyltransferase involved in cell wall biosynthesis
MNNFKVILIGNYACDKQVSMNSFLNILALGLKKEGFEFEIWKPIVCFGYFVKNTNKGIGKWFGYLDKYVITTIYFFIKVLIHKLTQVNCVYHICDHSNSIYISLFPLNKILVTCHDVLAIRGALGFKDAYCEASGFGKILQQFILKNLRKNISIAFVSKNTKNQFIALGTNHFQNKYQVIYNGLNADFKKLEIEEVNKLIQKYSSFPTQKYILHVGSNLTRKNRVLLVKMIYELKDNYDGLLCFAGQKPDNHLLQLASDLKVNDRICFIQNPNHELLNLLYNQCDAFIFPSLSEGFGWPIIEAQTCGTPVICSNIEPLPEIGENGVITANPFNEVDFAKSFLLLNDTLFRDNLIQKGIENAQKYTTQKMVNNYINFYKTINQ